MSRRGMPSSSRRSILTTFVFETHSISEDNERGIATGWLPGALSARGRELAAELGRRRRDTTDVVLTSDLRRAVETAEIAFTGCAVPIHQDVRLRECNYGDLNGATVSDVHARRLDHLTEPFPNGQSYTDCVDGVRSFLEDLAEYDGRRVLVVGHSATRWALEHLLLGTPLRDAIMAPFAWQAGWEYPLTPAR